MPRHRKGRLCCLLDEEQLDNQVGLSATTMHGLTHAVAASSKLRQLVWSALVFLCLCGLFWLLIDKTVTFMGNPSTTSTQRVSRPSINFPAVTVCNNERFSRSNSIGGPFERTTHNLQPPLPFTLEEAVAAGFQLRETVLACTHGYRECDPKEFKHTYDAIYGNCFTFNGYKQSFTLHDPITNITTVYNDANRLKTVVAGRHQALTLTMSVNVFDYPPASQLTGDEDELLYAGAASAGIRYFIHDQLTPFSSSLALLAPPGFSTSIQLQQRVDVELPHPFSNCSTTLGTSVPYSVEQCLLTCLDATTRRDLHCAALPPFDVPGIPACMTDVQTYYELLITTSSLQDALRMCDCKEPCTEISFAALGTSTGVFPTPSLVHELARAANVSNDNIRNNVLDLRISFGTMRVVESRKTAAYGFTSLLSDFGGQLGLFAGISLLTLAELAEACGARCGCCCCKRREKTRLRGTSDVTGVEATQVRNPSAGVHERGSDYVSYHE